MNSAQISAWISDPRFDPFLDAANGEATDALDLYMWHAQLVGASFITLHHFEVLVRNAVDRRLGHGQPIAPLHDTWLLDDQLLSPAGLEKVAEVEGRLADEGSPQNRDNVVAGLSFSFWKSLLAGRYEDLWRRQLRHAFSGAKRRKDIHDMLIRLQLWRNRLAHHDSLLSVRNDYRFVEMIQIATFIDPAAGQWLKQSSPMLTVLRSRPGRAPSSTS